MWSRSTSESLPTSPIQRSDGAVPLMRWELRDGTQCVIAALGNLFEVCLIRDGDVVRASRFAMPGPAFDVARAWRRDVQHLSRWSGDQPTA
jgi:hypothetical protein